MAVEGGAKFLKFAVFFFNFVIFLGGIAILVVGTLTLVDGTAVHYVTTILDTHMYKSSSYILLASGAILLVLGFLGCCGAMKENKCMLAIFFAALLVIFIVLLAGGITAALFKETAIKTLKEQMYGTLKTYGTDGDLRTDTWNAIQRSFKCCGVEGDKDSDTSWYYYQTNTTWFTKQTGANKTYVPVSCCVADGTQIKDKAKCVGTEVIPNAPPRTKPPASATNEFLYTSGCYDQVKTFIITNAPAITGVGIGIALLLVLAIVFSICLYRNIKPEYET